MPNLQRTLPSPRSMKPLHNQCPPRKRSLCRRSVRFASASARALRDATDYIERHGAALADALRRVIADFHHLVFKPWHKSAIAADTSAGKGTFLGARLRTAEFCGMFEKAYPAPFAFLAAVCTDDATRAAGALAELSDLRRASALSNFRSLVDSLTKVHAV